MIPRSIDRILSAFPGAIGAHYCGYKAYRWGDPYLRLVSLLADRSRLSVDIGAHEGDYAYFMRRHSAGCIAYECNPRLVLAALQGQNASDTALAPDAMVA